MSVRSPIAITVLALAACASPAPEAPLPETPQAAVPAAGGRDDAAKPATTVAERAQWFTALAWPGRCERAFAVTRSGDDGGLEIHDLADGSSIALVRCAPGAYQPTSVVMHFRRERPRATARLLALPYYRSPYGEEIIRATAPKITGETRWLADQQSLVVLSLSRQSADCGVWTRYSLAGGKPEITGLATRLPCPEGADMPVGVNGGDPPPGWRVVQPD